MNIIFYSNQLRLRPGDVFRNGGRTYMVDRTTESGARAIPVTGVKHEVTTRFGETAEFESKGGPIYVSLFMEPAGILEHRGQKGLDDFLASKRRRGGKQEAAQQQPAAKAATTETETDNMSKKGSKKRSTKETKPKAERKPRAAKTPKPAGNGAVRMDKIMDFSVCSVVRRLGAEGVSKPHAAAILKVHGIEMPDKSLGVQLWFGKAGMKEAAALTKDQLAELKKSAEEPTPEPKAEAKAAA